MASESRIWKWLGAVVCASVTCAQAEAQFEPTTTAEIVSVVGGDETIEELVALGVQSNPRIAKLQAEAEAAWSRVPQARSLPDPMIGGTGFGHPIETAAGAQRGTINVSQRFPWLGRLSAQARQAAAEAQSMEYLVAAERLQLAAEIKSGIYRMYVVERQLASNRQNEQIIEGLLRVASARVQTGGAGQGDVLRATFELSRLNEEDLTLEQQLASARAQVNALLSRPSNAPIDVPSDVDSPAPEWGLETLQYAAMQAQPELASAALRIEAAGHGVRVARLQQVPELTFNANWFSIDDNRPSSAIVDIGEDAWSIGAMINVPIWHQKYRAMRSEAGAEYRASVANLRDMELRIEATVADWLAKAKASARIAELYRSTIVPQAAQTLQADQQAYQQGAVEFDRVAEDFRNVVNAEFGYHRAAGELANALAQLERAVGAPLETIAPMTNTPGDTSDGQADK